MSESPESTSASPQVISPDGRQVEPAQEDKKGTPLNELVEQPAKVMRIGSMIRQLLDEVKAAPLDEAGRARLRDIHETSISELKDGLAPELVEELERLHLPFDEESPSRSRRRARSRTCVSRCRAGRISR